MLCNINKYAAVEKCFVMWYTDANGGYVMKKLISLIIAVVMAFCMLVPSFAADKAKFGVTVVSEDDSTAVVSVDYNGGSTFNCLDFEVKLSGRLKVEKCENGAGLRNFKIYVDDLNTDDATLSSFNKDSNPVAFTFATTADFKAVNGKDLLVITLKKTTADKLTADDVKLTVTNCGVSAANGGADAIGTSVTQLGEKTDGGSATAPGQVGATVAKTDKTDASGTTTSVTEKSEQSSTGGSDSSAGEKTETEKTDTNASAKLSDKKKIVIIAAAAACMVLVIAAGVVYIAKKAKKEDAE